jgi:hypothetical protein
MTIRAVERPVDRESFRLALAIDVPPDNLLNLFQPFRVT